jgi:hypothetical protein
MIRRNMSDPRSITADALEILLTRELRKAGIEPQGLQRHWLERLGAQQQSFAFQLRGRLEVYGRRWSVLAECRNTDNPIATADIELLRQRRHEQEISSALLCCTNEVTTSALATARALHIPVLRVADAQLAYVTTGMIQPGQLPAWVPEYALEVLSLNAADVVQAALLQADEPELLLQHMRSA